jgi:site-specific recombinase XerD
MAIRSLNNRFQVDVQIDGVRFRESFGSYNEAKAREKALRRYPDRFIADKVPSPTPKAPTLSEVLWWLYRDIWSHSNASPTYRATIKLLEGHFGTSMPIDTITTNMIHAFVSSERLRGQQASSINRRLSVLSRALTWAMDEHIITTKPRISRLPEDRKVAHCFDPDEVQLILDGFDALGRPEMGRFTAVLYGTGARPSEALRVHAAHVDLAKNTVQILAGKTHAARVIDLSATARSALVTQMGTVGTDRLFTFSYDAYEHQWARVRTRLHKTEDPKWIIYTLRHTFATLLAPKVDISTLAYLMGHSRLEQTMRYIKIRDTLTKEAVGNLPDVGVLPSKTLLQTPRDS